MNNKFWNSLPRTNVGIRRVNGASWMLLFDVMGAAAIAAWLIWHFV